MQKGFSPTATLARPQGLFVPRSKNLETSAVFYHCRVTSQNINPHNARSDENNAFKYRVKEAIKLSNKENPLWLWIRDWATGHLQSSPGDT